MTAWHWTYEGATWGSGAAIDLDVVAVEGLRGVAAKVANVPRLGHGSRLGRMEVPERTFTMEVETGVDGHDAMAELVAALSAAWAPRHDEAALTFEVEGEEPRRIYCRPERFVLPLVHRFVLGYFAGAVQWSASDARIFSDAEHSEVTGRGEPGDGLAPPWTPPLSFPAGTTGAVSAPNAGTAPARWSIRLDGPLVNPVITHTTSGRALHLTANGGLDLAATQWLTVDGDTGAMLLNDTGDRRTILRLPESRFFDLDPGDNVVALTADSGAGTMSVTWRDAWWS